MDRFWWHIPGPNQFVSKIVQDLGDGKNAILCLPEHMPDGLASAVRSELGEDWDWHTLSLRDEDRAEPVHQLTFLFARLAQRKFAIPGSWQNIRTLPER